ncbi:NF-kappa-B inhibitor cactus-like [Arctopsyche grandis]|uniref:NF-kappa-B inhibitor cactus-like n=1 Tax=Arctopsyche grandis TaxID=121162 RepID=UPI00406D82FD
MNTDTNEESSSSKGKGVERHEQMDSGVGLTAPLDSGILDSAEDLDLDLDLDLNLEESKPAPAHSQPRQPHQTSEQSQTIDSGLELSDSFSGLSVDGMSSRNNLSETQIPAHQLPVNIPVSKSDDCSWQIYFQQDDEGDTQLHLAIINEMPDAVTALLQMCPYPVLLDIFNDSRQAPIHLAVLTGQPHIARRLLIAGAKVNSRDANGNTPLHLACAMGDLACLRALITPLAPHPQVAARAHSLPHALDQINHDGQTCVHVAAIGGHIEILRHLVWFGANINATENKSGRTALHLAIESGNIALLQYLVTECPLVAMDIRTYSGHTALQLGEGAVRDQLLAAGYIRQEGESDIETDEYSDEDDSDDNEVPFYNSNFYNSSLRNAEAINVA